jgi:pimeloyl-ACP methyl ester carboxylesterase
MSSSLHYLPLFERLPHSIRVIAPDMRGFGDSTYHHRFDSLYDLAEDLLDFVDQLHIKKATLVGWSTGGGVALRMAAVRPQLVEKIVLIESMSHKGYPLFKKDEKGQPLLGQVYPTKDTMALDPVQVAPAVAAMTTKNVAFMSYLWDVAIYSVNKPTPEQNKLFIDETLKQRNLIDIDWSLANFNMGDSFNFYTMGDHSIGKVTAPVLSIWSKKDYVVLEYMVRETVAALGTKATLKVYDNSGHSPLVDCPDQLTTDILAFVK